MSETTGANRRQVQGLLIRPRQQLRLSFLMLSCGMGAFLFLSVIGAVSLYRTLGNLQAIYGLDEEIMKVARESMLTTFSLMGVLALILGIASVIFGIKWTHRIFGPIVPIRAHIEHLKAGNYSARVHLRDGDELLEIRDALNELAEDLEKKYQQGPS